ncbi:MAG: DUF1476 domain-containing protein [Hyphomicrobiaceae bacterium]
MTTFDQREKAFEDKYIYDANLKFMAQARRNKRLGAWACDKLGLSGTAAVQAYVRGINQADLAEDGDEDVVRKLKADFAATSITVSDGEIRRQMDEYYAQSLRELASGL